MDGVRGYHNTAIRRLKLPDGQCLPPPSKVAVDRNNISKVHSALIQSFQESSVENNPYRLFKEGHFYAIMHDGMQMFGMELNGVILRYAIPDLDIVNIPWKLAEIPGGSMNAAKLITHHYIYPGDTIRDPWHPPLSLYFMSVS